MIAIGDIHGCRQTLEQLIETLAPRPDDQLVFLGDYIDRGPDSKGVIDYLLQLRRTFRCFFLMGNHELMFLDYLESGDPGTWLDNGGRETLASYTVQDGHHLPEAHIDFMKACSYILETEHFVFVHGGLDPEMSIQDNRRYMQPADFCWIRTHLRRSYVETRRYNWKKTVVCGHTPSPDIINLGKLISLDTGCVYDGTDSLGKLSAVILPERKVIQVSNQDR